MDREKVVKGLETCKSSDKTCSDCPYNGEVCTTSLCDDVLTLLKEQKPMPVKIDGQMFTVKYGHCPKCGEGLNSEVYPHWCGFCGQKVKWDD